MNFHKNDFFVYCNITKINPQKQFDISTLLSSLKTRTETKVVKTSLPFTPQPAKYNAES
jgi:hypothetical protein